MLYSADGIFDGSTELRDVAIETNDGFVTQLLPLSDVAPSAPLRHFSGCRIVPAFVDAQVYGAGGRLFSAYPDTHSLRLLAAHAWKGGAALVQPTVATNSGEVVHGCIDAVRTYWREGGEGIAGLHLEGPWINPARKGAHVEAFIHRPDADEVRGLLAYGRGVIRTVTLAPEQCGSEVIDLLIEAGIVISAGHSDIGYAEALHSFDRISTVTHLYNAMSPLHHRAPGLVGACLLHDAVHASIIPDGHHADFAAAALAHRNMNGRLFAITDAVTDTTIGPYLHEWSCEGYYTSNGTLSGSGLTMEAAFQNLVKRVGIKEAAALEMCSSIPARVFGWDRFGRIGPGAAACLLVYDQHWNLVERISEPGSRSPAACGGGHTE
ncbi:MAG: N-acetylglucosamine-6-phosphate deacetylase [Chitinophagaceae bacterium]|nr:MAG: N-acetylglucosamine-6-phosphate deacetylase [Chitinophagaceae bacterium]